MHASLLLLELQLLGPQHLEVTCGLTYSVLLFLASQLTMKHGQAGNIVLTLRRTLP